MFPQNQNTAEQEPVAHSTDMSANFETELWRAAALHSWFSVEWVISLVRALFVEIRYLCRSHLGKCSISQWRCEWNACRLFSIYILSVYKASGLSLSLVDRNCCHCVVVYFSPLLPPSTPHVLTHSARLLANQFLRCALLQFFFLYLLLKWVGCECIANAVIWQFVGERHHTHTETSFQLNGYKMTCGKNIPIYSTTIDCLFDSALDGGHDGIAGKFHRI